MMSNPERHEFGDLELVGPLLDGLPDAFRIFVASSPPQVDAARPLGPVALDAEGLFTLASPDGGTWTSPGPPTPAPAP